MWGKWGGSAKNSPRTVNDHQILPDENGDSSLLFAELRPLSEASNHDLDLLSWAWSSLAGISTEIGSLKGQIPWSKVKEATSTNRFVLIVGVTGNAFFIPSRAFTGPEQQGQFMTHIGQWRSSGSADMGSIGGGESPTLLRFSSPVDTQLCLLRNWLSAPS